MNSMQSLLHPIGSALLAFGWLLTMADAKAEDPEFAHWVAPRTAGVTIDQTPQGKLYYPGKLSMAGLTISLGETPPLMHYQVKAGNGALLLGEMDDRHSYRRYLSTARIVSGVLKQQYEISVSYPKSATPGGIAFRRNESLIHTVGLVIPDIKIPKDVDPSSLDWSIQIRLERQSRYLEAKDLSRIQPEVIGSDIIILMQTHPGQMPSSARILWLKFDEEGALVQVDR